VYGHHGKTKLLAAPHKFPSRQSYESCQAIARLHLIPEEETVFAQQHPEALDAGVIHNDIICAGNKLVFMYHEKAFVNAEKVLEELRAKVLNTCRKELCEIKITEAQLPLKEAVNTYFFNSQIISLPDGKMAFVAPVECRGHPQAQPLLDAIIADKNPIEKVLFFNLKQSMQNGGGPGCLRLPIVLTREEIAAANPYVFLNESLYKNLVDWVNEHYREELRFEDLADPMLLVEVRYALDKLTELLDLGPLYRFQQ
jgi:succinylarginine dihydrolase